MVQETTESRTQIAAAKPFCSEVRFRNITGYTNQLDLPSATLNRFLLGATEQVKRDAFIMRREELVVKDDEGRYFPTSQYFANKYGRSINTGKVTAEDLTVYEIDTATVVGTRLYSIARTKRMRYNISHAIASVDPFNNYFTLQDGYPTNNRQVVLTYCYVRIPMAELVGVDRPLETACLEHTNVLFLKWLRDKRLKKGTTTLALGSQTIAKDETEVRELLDAHTRRYHEQINYMKSFNSRSFTIGRGHMARFSQRGYGGRGYSYN